ncbi:hypothetical protein B0O99DRAFT_132880 [Bisporella sp. PMI_857]|nr:hypothetical protein B0O99DRAFT_132880 [Bisporella sp. PMI_857]
MMHAISIAVLLIVPGMFYHSYTNFLYLDESLSREVIAVSVPIAVLFTFLALDLLLAKLEKRSKGPAYTQVKKPIAVPKKTQEKQRRLWYWCWYSFGIFPVCVLIIYMFFHVWIVGVGFILLGQITDDTWGASVLNGGSAKASIALNAIFVPISISIAAFSGSA